MLKWLMHRIQNVTRIGSANLRMACEMQQLDARIQIRIEILCGKYDTPSLMYAIQMNRCTHALHKVC